MATITLTIPDEQVQRVINALCQAGETSPTTYRVDLQPVEPIAANAKSQMIGLVKRLVVAYEKEHPPIAEPDIS